MKLYNYYYHGLQNPKLLPSILENGLLSRSYLKKKNIDKFSSSKDFLGNEGTNGLETICVCSYKTLSYYLFSFPNISLIIKKDDKYKIKIGGLEGEYLIEDKIPKENIIAIGIRVSKLDYYNKITYNYISSLKENLNYIKQYKLPIIDLETGLEIKEKDLSNMFDYLKLNKKANIIIAGPIFSGKKDIIKELKYLGYEMYISNDITTKEEFIKRYKAERNNKNILIFQNSLLDYKKNFSLVEWNNILNELKINEKDLINNYDLVIHLYSMVNKYKNIYNKNIPKSINAILKEDEKIHKIWRKNNNYFKVLPKDEISEKLKEVIKIIENFA